MQEGAVNVFDEIYRQTVGTIPEANVALFAVLDHVQASLDLEPPSRIVTAMTIAKEGRNLFAIDLVDIHRSSVLQLAACRAYAAHEGEIDTAVADLALHGCRGNELAFVCLRELGGKLCYWVLAELATMRPVVKDGDMVKSSGFFW